MGRSCTGRNCSVSFCSDQHVLSKQQCHIPCVKYTASRWIINTWVKKPSTWWVEKSGVNVRSESVFNFARIRTQERQIVFPLLWNHLKPNGILFVNQTPYRWFPVENHTTSGLPLINYMPDSIASYVASRFSVRDLANDTWPILLRKGIRGGSVGEIFRILKNSSCPPDLLAPSRLGLSDRIDLWYAVSGKTRHQSLKKLLLYIFKFIKVSTGQIFLPTLSLAIRKRANNQCKNNCPTAWGHQ